MTLVELLVDVKNERHRQDKLWGTSFRGRDPNVWLAILLEEVGEVAEENDPDKLVEELVQVAAVALSIAEHVEDQGPIDEGSDGAYLRMDAVDVGMKAKYFLNSKNLG